MFSFVWVVLCRVLCRVSRREQFLETVLRMYLLHCAAESRKASVRSKVEHPFLIVKRDFGFTKLSIGAWPRTATTCTCCSPQRTG